MVFECDSTKFTLLIALRQQITLKWIPHALTDKASSLTDKANALTDKVNGLTDKANALTEKVNAVKECSR